MDLANSEALVVLVERVTLGPGALEARIRIPDARFVRTRGCEGLVSRALTALPGLRRHRCECGVPHGIEAELADTETAHLVEHLALEIMAASGSPRTLAGRTRWDAAVDGPGVFHVRLEYDDEAIALGALALAARLASALLTGAGTPHVEVEVRRLEQLRSRPHA